MSDRVENRAKEITDARLAAEVAARKGDEARSGALRDYAEAVKVELARLSSHQIVFAEPVPKELRATFYTRQAHGPGPIVAAGISADYSRSVSGAEEAIRFHASGLAKQFESPRRILTFDMQEAARVVAEIIVERMAQVIAAGGTIVEPAVAERELAVLHTESERARKRDALMSEIGSYVFRFVMLILFALFARFVVGPWLNGN